jgi:hypothetical protein
MVTASRRGRGYNSIASATTALLLACAVPMALLGLPGVLATLAAMRAAHACWTRLLGTSAFDDEADLPPGFAAVALLAAQPAFAVPAVCFAGLSLLGVGLVGTFATAMLLMARCMKSWTSRRGVGTSMSSRIRGLQPMIVVALWACAYAPSRIARATCGLILTACSCDMHVGSPTLCRAISVVGATFATTSLGWPAPVIVAVAMATHVRPTFGKRARRCRKLASKPASQTAGQAASQPADQPASQPAN